jgi:hypothetical protein
MRARVLNRAYNHEDAVSNVYSITYQSFPVSAQWNQLNGDYVVDRARHGTATAVTKPNILVPFG